MKVPGTKRLFWQQMYEHGDIILIARRLGCSRATVSRALKRGVCSHKIVKDIDTFYEERLRNMAIDFATNMHTI